MKKILCVIISAILMAGTASVAMAEEQVLNAELTFVSDAQELNLTDAGEFTVAYSIDNKSLANRITALASYTLSDEDGNVLWSGESDIVVSPGGTKSFKCTGTVSKYGVHTLKISIKDKNTGEVLTGEKEISLSRSNLKLNEYAGVSAHFAWNSNPNSTIPYLGNMGAKFVRDEIYWKDYELKKGEYKLPQKADDYINKFVENGLEPLIILDFGNALYTENNDSYPQTDTQIEAYGNYVYNLVKDLKGRVKYFEVWNEFNLNGTNTGGTYAKILKTAYLRAKEANPECVILGPVTAGASNTFFANMLWAVPNIKDYVDIASYHEYYAYAPETEEYENTLEYCSDTIRKYFGSDTEIWLTEMGWSEGNEDITEREAAMYTVRHFLNNSAEKLVDKLFVYGWINHYGHSNPYEANLGLLNGDLSAKKGYVAMSAMNYFLTDFELSERVIDSNDNYIYKYKKGENEEVTVAYNVNDDAKTVAIDTEFGNSVLYDMYGNKIRDLSGDTSYNVSVTGAPVYIVSRKDPVYMDYKTNTAEIYGKIEGALASEQIMVYVTKPGTQADEVLDDGSLVYVEQIGLGEDGYYEFKFPMNQQAGVYNIYIGYGKNDMLIGPVRLEVVRIVTGYTGVYNDSGKLNTMADIMASETDILAKATVDNKYNAKIKTVLYVAGVKGDRVLWTEAENKEISGYGQHTISVNLNKQTALEADEIRLYLWSEDMKPVANQVTFIE